MSGKPDFARVYDEELEAVYGFVAYRTGTREEAEDLTQATFLRAFAAWERYDPERSGVRTWLLAIANNQVIDSHRRVERHRLRHFSEGERDGDGLAAAGPEDELDIQPALAEALDQLDQRARNLVALRYGADLSGPEIAEVTGLSLSNVQQILSRSIRRLRELLAAWRPPTSSG